MACTTCYVFLASTVSHHHKNTLGRASDCSGHITKLEQSTFLRYLWLISRVFLFIVLKISVSFTSVVMLCVALLSVVAPKSLILFIKQKKDGVNLLLFVSVTNENKATEK
jgi:hypothetical protein